ncbi:hypothetical protein BST95_13250 [Halioglobus japonicus]|uniref:Uncharacterized protein n=1 Tax=Halioglobus japonicus TaxID=930805 RepID=A0AAP8SPV7_9GAMM|nr:hypothetical protein BST95_13250 [Halioglobus japonicus]PLW87914.1 hypothetical protein C0029_04945 [Halioglobus japonicus]
MDGLAVGTQQPLLRSKLIVAAAQLRNECGSTGLPMKTQMPNIGISGVATALVAEPGVGLVNGSVTGDGIKQC